MTAPRIAPLRIASQVRLSGPSELVYAHLAERRTELVEHNRFAVEAAARALAAMQRVANGQTPSLRCDQGERMRLLQLDGSRALPSEDLFAVTLENERGRLAVRAWMRELIETLSACAPEPRGLRECVAAVGRAAARVADESILDLSDGAVDETEAARYDRLMDELEARIDEYRAARQKGIR